MRRGTRKTPNGVSVDMDQSDLLPQTVLSPTFTITHRRKRKTRQRYHCDLLQLRSRFSQDGRFARTVLLALAAVASLLISSFYLFSRFKPFPSSSQPLIYGTRHTRNLDISVLAAQDFTIVFPKPLIASSSSLVFSPPLLSEHQQLLAARYDHGGLLLNILENEALRLQRRAIYHDFNENRGYDALISGPNDDDYVEYYYLFDDDYKRNPLVGWDDPDIHKKKQCRRTNWYRDLPINCNKLHEFDIEHRFRGGDTKYLGCVVPCVLSFCARALLWQKRMIPSAFDL